VRFSRKAEIVSEHGFTLLELIVVVAMLGIFTALAIPSFEGYIARTRQVEARTLLANLYKAEYAYFAEKGKYTNSLKELGFQPDGNLRYNVGFAETPGTVTDTFYLCQGTSCHMMIPDFKNKGWAQDKAFQAHAIGQVGGMVADEWTIDQDSQLLNTVTGL